MGGGVLEAKKLGNEAAEDKAAWKRSGLAAKKLEAKQLSSWAAEPKKLCAFTLAEVLITLAIIGVVAALTIPVIVAKYQQKQYYTQFMKAYNTLSNAISMAVAENGEYNAWDSSSRKEIITSYLKVQRKCLSSSDNCSFNSLTAKALNADIGEMSYGDDTFYSGDNGDAYILSDGVVLTFFFDSNNFDLYLDSNGTKEPNTMGRDIFMLSYRKIDGVYKLVPPYLYTTDNTSSINYSMSYDEAMDELLNNDDMITNCTTEKTSVGNNCSGRLLLEGKMNY